MVSRREKEKTKRRKSDAKKWARDQKTFEATCVKLPPGVEMYKMVPGTVRLDFMSYVTGKGNVRADEGMVHFEREYHAHRIQTASGMRLYCCRAATFGKPCPVCEWLTSHGNSDPDKAKSLRATVRHIWLVNDKPGDPKNPLKVLDTNHYNKGKGFGEQIGTAIDNLEDYASFADAEGGYTLQLVIEEQTFPGGKYNAPTRIDFIRRKYDYPDEVVENAPCLDAMLIDVGYDALVNLMETGSTASESEGKSEKVTSPSKSEKEDDEDDDKDEVTAEEAGIEEGDTVVYDGEECEILKVSGDGTSLTLKGESGKVYKAISPGEVSMPDPEEEEPDEDEDEDEDEDTPPPSKTAKGKKTAPPPEDDEEEDDEEEEEEEEDDSEEDGDDEDEPPPPPKKRGKK